MTPDPSTLFTAASTAFPRYTGVLSALAALIAADPAAAPPPVPVPPPVTPDPSALTIVAGRHVSLDSNGMVSNFDFGDPAGQFNTLRGYNAAHVYEQPGSYLVTVTPDGGTPVRTPVIVVADARPRVAVPADADLAVVLAQVTAPVILLLPGGSTFDLKIPSMITADGVTLRGGPGPAPRIRRLAGPSYNTLIITGANVSIEGIEFDGDRPLQPTGNTKVALNSLDIRSHHVLVRDCVFRNVDNGLLCHKEAADLLALNCRFTHELRSCAAYLEPMRNAVMLGLTAADSLFEHIIRVEGARNVLVHGCDVDNHGGKETIAIRVGDCVAVIGSTIRCWTRISQGMQAQPGVYCTKVLFANNRFTGTGFINPWVALNPGAQSVVFDANAFDVDPTRVCVAVQAPVADVRLSNNRLCLMPGAATCRPLVNAFGNPAWTETGTVTVPAVPAAPAVIPATR